MDLPTKRFDFPKQPQENRIHKKAKHSECFLLLTNIPGNFSASFCSHQKEFTPVIKEKSVGITFLTFSQTKDRSNCIEMIKKSSQISLFCFDQRIVLQKESSATNLANEISSIHVMTKNLVMSLNQIDIANEQESYRIQLENLEKETKNACREYLSKIMLYLEDFFFTINMTDICDKEWEDNIFLTHALFGVCCFLLFKYNENGLGLFFEYIKCFKMILNNIEIKSIHGDMKIFAIDFIYRIVFLKGQFQNELCVLREIAFESNSREKSLPRNFRKLDSKIYNLMLAGHSKIIPELEAQEYAQYIRSFLNKVYFINLPDQIMSFTCMNSIVFIKYPVEFDDEFMHSPSKAFAFLTILHELGNFYLRKNFQLKSEWFNFETLIDSSAHRTGKPEGSTKFIIKIFEEEFFNTSYYGSEYVLDEKNWSNKSLSVFRNEFLKKNSLSPVSDEIIYKSVRLKKYKANSSTILLGTYGRKY